MPHPQLVATNRHVSCGGVDLVDLGWSDGELHGVSDLVGGDPYTLYFTEPAGYRFAGAEAKGAAVTAVAREGALRVVRLGTPRAARVSWSVRWRAVR